jgi:23S rRNA pseudouridine2605 synthase
MSRERRVRPRDAQPSGRPPGDRANAGKSARGKSTGKAADAKSAGGRAGAAKGPARKAAARKPAGAKPGAPGPVATKPVAAKPAGRSKPSPESPVVDVQTGEKLQKVLADLGYASRRAIEQWIEAGRVVVNGEPAHLGQRVGPADRILVDGEPLRQARRETPRVLVLNKAAGVICTRSDPEGRPTVFDGLPRLQAGRWIAVGRLDFLSAGLLLITNDGALANRMMHPATGLDREYAVRVNGKLTDAQIGQLKRGIEVEGEVLRFSDLRYYNGSASNHWYHVVLMEGKNREVRRLFEAVGLVVSRLKRVRYGPVFLASTLRSGHWAEMGDQDLKALYRLVGVPVPAADRRRGRGHADRERQPSLLLPYPELKRTPRE